VVVVVLVVGEGGDLFEEYGQEGRRFGFVVGVEGRSVFVPAAFAALVDCEGSSAWSSLEYALEIKLLCKTSTTLIRVVRMDECTTETAWDCYCRTAFEPNNFHCSLLLFLLCCRCCCCNIALKSPDYY